MSGKTGGPSRLSINLNEIKRRHPQLKRLVPEIVGASRKNPAILEIQRGGGVVKVEFKHTNAFAVRKVLGAISDGRPPQINPADGIKLRLIPVFSQNAEEQYKDLLDGFKAETNEPRKLAFLNKIFKIAINGGKHQAVFITAAVARNALQDNFVDFFEAFVALMQLQGKKVQDHFYISFYALSRRMLEKEYARCSTTAGITSRTTAFWTILITVARIRKIRTFFNSATLLTREKSAARAKIRETERDQNVVKIKEMIWSLVHVETNLLNYGIEEEMIPVNQNEVWISEEEKHMNQPMALLMPHSDYARCRFYDRLYSLRQALEIDGCLPRIRRAMDPAEIRGEANAVIFYERWTDDLITELRHTRKREKARLILTSPHVKNIVLMEKDGITTAHLLWGFISDKDGQLCLARFTIPREIHYIYRALKTPSASNASELGVPIAVNYPLGLTCTRKTSVAQILSAHEEETGVRIPRFLEFKEGSLNVMDLDSFGAQLNEHFPAESFNALVVKPDTGLGGRGIDIFERSAVERIFGCARSLSSYENIMIEEGIQMARVNIDGEDFDSTLRFHVVKDAKGKAVVYRGIGRIGHGVVNIRRRARDVRMRDVFRHMADLHLSEDNIETLLARAERSALRIHGILGPEIDHMAVDLYFDGKDFILNEVNVGNIGGEINFNRLYPESRGMLTDAICGRLITRASAYHRNVRKKRRWRRAGAHTIGTEAEIALTTIGRYGHRRQTTFSEASMILRNCRLPESPIHLDTSAGVESITGYRDMYEVRGETMRFAQRCHSLIGYLREVAENTDGLLISCTGQYGSGIHLNLHGASYGEDKAPNQFAVADYHRIKAVLPLISALSTNPSEGFWHPLSRELGIRRPSPFFSVGRYGDIIYNPIVKIPGTPPRLEIRPPDTPLHPAYIGLYYAIIFAALAGTAPRELSFKDYHRAFCNGAMENLRGAVLYDGKEMTLRDALDRFYETNREIFDELDLSEAQQELLDAARLNGFTYKDFNDGLGSIFNEDAYLRIVTDIFERGCLEPERKLSDIIETVIGELSEDPNISPQKIEVIKSLAGFFIYRPGAPLPAEESQSLPEIKTLEQDTRVVLRMGNEEG
jgi:hypothetical protein